MVHITAYGPVEYLGENGETRKRDSPSSLREAYLRFCAETGIEALDPRR